MKKRGILHQRNMRRSSYMKFYPFWFMGCRVMALDRQTDRRRDGRTDKVVTICSTLREYKKYITE